MVSFSASSPGKAKASGIAKHSVLVVDDDDVTRCALGAFLHDAGYHVIEARDFDQVKLALREHCFSVVLMDLVFAGHDYGGFDIIHYMRAMCPITAMIIVTSNPSTDSAVTALRIKVNDYLTKPVRKSELLGTVMNALPNLQTEKEKMCNDALSIREREVLYLLYKGLSYQEMSDILDCSVSTAKTYGRRVYRKLGVGTRAEAVYEAIHQGLVSN